MVASSLGEVGHDPVSNPQCEKYGLDTHSSNRRCLGVTAPSTLYNELCGLPPRTLNPQVSGSNPKARTKVLFSGYLVLKVIPPNTLGEPNREPHSETFAFELASLGSIRADCPRASW
jgi:hypothetical protein